MAAGRLSTLCSWSGGEGGDCMMPGLGARYMGWGGGGKGAFAFLSPCLVWGSFSLAGPKKEA